MSTMIVVAAVVFGLIAACVTLITFRSLHMVEKYLGELGDDERCPSILSWHATGDKLERVTSVTRCTLRTGHEGPHHTKKPDTDQDHWWPRKKPAKPDLEQKGKVA
jgi:hypothetical protein